MIARDEAIAASHAKSEFLATTIHEIRTAMTGVIGLSNLLLDTPLTETQGHYVEGVRASGEALLGVIDDIIDFSEIEAGALALETADFDLGVAVGEVVSLVAPSASAKGVQLLAYCRPDLPKALSGDVGRLRRILLNLLSNAVKFTSAGEVVLRAQLDREPTATQVFVRFEVAGTGVGIDPASAERLFAPVSQADASATRRSGGTGLGLVISRRLAEAMGGTLGFDSRPGEGSTLWFRLAFARAIAAIAAPETVSHSLQGRRVLVVDDNRSYREVLVAQLQAWDITADAAGDAGAALEFLQVAAAEANPYDVALLDMALPGMDGLQLAAAISADQTLASVRLILLSSLPVEAAVAARAGFVARLAKPVPVSDLYDAVIRAMSLTLIQGMEERSSAPAIARRSAGKVLIVEDNAMNQLVAKGMLTRLGFAYDVAGDGREALAAVERHSYDAILMDCHLPEMDGLEATAEIRRRESGGRHIPIIAMTASVLVDDRKSCIDAGMDDYLSKPMTLRVLEAMLKRWVTREGPGQSEAVRLRPDIGI